MGISDHLSVQDDDATRPETSPADTAAAMVQKWGFHFAKPPMPTMVVGLTKPMKTATLIENLEFDDKLKHGIEV